MKQNLWFVRASSNGNLRKFITNNIFRSENAFKTE